VEPGVPVRVADLGLGAVHPRLDALGLGVGEDVRQGLQLQSRPVGYGEPAGGEGRTDSTDGLGG
jgi:hypothetical protein